MRCARELYEIMRETLVADPAAGEYARGLCESTGNNLDQLHTSMRSGNH
ncbi:MAG: hypothetical protein GZ089_00490 [Aromatoleum sp.]|nr:hypothetical protein [Aromatoleum sp.]